MNVETIAASYERLHQGLDSAVRLGNARLRVSKAFLIGRFSKRVRYRINDRDKDVIDHLEDLVKDTELAGGRSQPTHKRRGDHVLIVSMIKESSLHKLFASVGKETMRVSWLDRTLGTIDSTNTFVR